MSELTYIKGKDACLEASITNMQTILQAAGFDIVEASWLNPVANVYSLHIHDARCPGLFTNGKGTSRKATLASALGEYLERLATNYFFSDYWLETEVDQAKNTWLYYPDEKQFSEVDIRDSLSPELWSFYDANDELEFVDLLSFNDSQNVARSVRMKNVHTEENVYFPMNLFSNLYASNGLSAGNTATEAQVQGLSEIFERWVKNKIMRENICLPEVPNSVVQSYPEIVKMIEGLKQEGIAVSIRDGSLGGEFPVISVILFEQSSGHCFASFGAHPMFEVALERTLTESLQGRQLGHLDGFQTPVFDEFIVAEDENIENHFIDSSGLIHAHFVSDNADFDFVHWDFSGSTDAQWSQLCDKVQAQGCSVYVANYNHYGFEACRIVVPGMSEIYPTDELIESNQNTGRLLREQLLALPETLDYTALVDLIDDLGLSDHQGVASLIGLMPDPKSFWAELKIIELKFWCYLAAKDYVMALENLEDALCFVSPTNAWLVSYRALQFALQMTAEDVKNRHSMVCLFGEALTDQAWSNIEGSEVFWGQPLGLAIFLSSQRHQALLQIYQQTQAVKRKAFSQ
ncbi:30S ribosomal protein S12 methylthiotransferase accessory factor YcaO [Thiomicrorhabdus arctica]|jgi:ribosomal protein S12 methylthiotransferase accessory factor|uniref:30S ribosomal protein S12 methylthiotransferase accessory factor YcaO n=1 Tax=Thiomicrorhabdus arctica TaxID=131540 RepID=UPI000380F14B|nr:30S ribosomal protein S12 methylthiotransferase accessory factor YcaO [Thiomicrorhabdus arctica]